ncbi:MAG TPA: hypothetical protein VGJ15_05665 [Pirellulales bacterium]|jgi:hypothetical protein
MTSLLQKAFTEASKLSAAEQDLLASWLLAEISGDGGDEFDQAISQTASKLAPLAEQAIAEFRAGLTEELEP